MQISNSVSFLSIASALSDFPFSGLLHFCFVRMIPPGFCQDDTPRVGWFNSVNETRSKEWVAGSIEHFNAVVIGAGFSGMYMLKSLREKLGLKVRVYEEAVTVGGTWYWTCYPGARCDSEAYIYCYTWDKELLREWSGRNVIPSNRKFFATSSMWPNATT
jgi:hypothetical protein